MTINYLQIALNKNYSPRAKHVDIKAKFIRQIIDMKEVVLEYLCKNEMNLRKLWLLKNRPTD